MRGNCRVVERPIRISGVSEEGMMEMAGSEYGLVIRGFGAVKHPETTLPTYTTH